MENYALIKNNKVINVVVFDNPTEELLNTFKEFHQVDYIVLSKDSGIGWDWDGIDFIPPKPHLSWVLNENKIWEAPIPKPDTEESYFWNENMLRWDKATQS